MKLPQLTLRDLFWLVLVIALVLGWAINWDRWRVDYNGNLNTVMRAKHREEELTRQIQSKGYAVEWDEDARTFKLTETK